MRRCNAPSQMGKRLSLSPVQTGSKHLRPAKSIKKNQENDNYDSDEEKEQKPPYSSPFSPGMLNVTSLSCDTNSYSPHELIIRRLLNKPFKIPIPNYNGLQIFEHIS